MTTQDHTLAARLLPCPFCGCEAEIERFGNRRQSTLYQCKGCSCSLETGEEWGHGSDWNTRASDQLITTAEADARVKAAVLAEREAIAAFVETHAYTVGNERKMEPSKQAINDMHHATIAAAIRSRGVTG